MASAAGAGGPQAAAGVVSSGMNPFWQASNLYAEKITSNAAQPGTSTTNQFQNVNPGNFLRGVRFLLRSDGTGTGIPTADNPSVAFASLDLENVDGGEIIYPMGGYAHLQAQRYFRPFTLDPTLAYSYSRSANPSIDLFVQPEIRLTAALLSNTDARSLYKYNYTQDTAAHITSGTAPTITITTYMDAWGQPDPNDLEGIANQPLPPGLALQMKRRHQAGVTLQASGTDNIFQLVNTGNALRGIIAIVRDSNGVRQDGFSDPIRWQQDNRNLGVFSPDQLFQWQNQQYADYQIGGRPPGVYVFTRFYNPGSMTGQGWLYTSNATKLTFETSTASGLASGTGTVEFITDEVYPVQATVPPDLLEI